MLRTLRSISPRGAWEGHGSPFGETAGAPLGDATEAPPGDATKAPLGRPPEPLQGMPLLQLLLGSGRPGLRDRDRDRASPFGAPLGRRPGVARAPVAGVAAAGRRSYSQEVKYKACELQSSESSGGDQRLQCDVECAMLEAQGAAKKSLGKTGQGTVQKS
ncbi:hypothetical protein PAL_GLEAN10019383 [Pteropus alecto]|uniref:Uncharacterized protein n=1 Tax=Pteropus alecto TaxID=9402 RepID=L5JVV6_PTEAL|nr:hypothetical protein PAL_GLEAN10019383 [Pteropus alecto]